MTLTEKVYIVCALVWLTKTNKLKTFSLAQVPLKNSREI